MSKHEKRLSFNKHLKSPVETVLSENVIDLRLLNKICFTSGMEGHATRSVAWKLMLGYLPLEKDTWQKKVSYKCVGERHNCGSFKRYVPQISEF